ncbi:hypothetical protein PTKIN_Ptkin11bG0067500 [Pterospermum kingtungense]
MDSLVKQLEKMTQLTRLRLFSLTEAHEKDLCFSIEKMEHLHDLSLSSDPKVPLKVDALSSVPRYLEKLGLIGKLEKVPRLFNTLLNLKTLSLQKSELREDLISSIQELPNLLFLHLSSKAFQGERLRFVEGIKKLRALRVQNCPQLDEIVMEKGAMPSLQRLIVLECKGYRKLPYGWNHLTHLKQVRLYQVYDELVESICGKGNGNLPAVPYILLTRTEDNDADDEVKSKLLHKILN